MALVDLMSCREWVKDLKELNPQVSNENDLRDQRKNHHVDLTNKLSDFQKIVDANAPFYQKNAYVIMKEIASEFEKINYIFFKYSNEIRLVDQVDSVVLDQACSKIDRKKNYWLKQLEITYSPLNAFHNNTAGRGLAEKLTILHVNFIHCIDASRNYTIRSITVIERV